MGTVKSIRLNDRTERMFNIVKHYLNSAGSKINDSEIIANGIEMQYNDISKDMNDSFREKMSDRLSDSSKEIFEQSCNMLEVLSISLGSVLEDEFYSFLIVNYDGATLYSEVDGDKTCHNKQYEKIYENIERSFGEKEIEKSLDEMHMIFKKIYGKED